MEHGPEGREANLASDPAERRVRMPRPLLLLLLTLVFALAFLNFYFVTTLVAMKRGIGRLRDDLSEQKRVIGVLREEAVYQQNETRHLRELIDREGR